MPKKLGVSILLLIFTSYAGIAQSTESFFAKADVFFKNYVEGGKVHYLEIGKNPDILNDLLKVGKNIRVSKENAKEFQAFWINAYNVLVIKSVIENYPLKSPLDIAGFFDKTIHEVGGLEITLNDIENKLLRENFPEEPRFHFVLVCAGLGCPPIIDRAYLPETLNAQLLEQTILALNDPSFIQQKGNKFFISEIFEWYRNDFEQNGRKLIDFINHYRTEKIAKSTKLSFYPYDWRINEAK
ncbi:MAG: DUF547 domain-containing protein [Flavobacteriaceae bacterium]